MKKKKTTLALFVTIILTATSCTKDRHWVKGEGSDVKNTRVTSAFTEISLATDATVELYQDSFYGIELNGQQNVLDVITTSSNGTTLSIDLKRHTELRRHNPVVIRIHMPQLTGLNISGSGKIESMKNFDMVNLRVNISGSGDVRMNGNISGALTANISGSGDMTFNGIGTCASANYTISGSGNMNAEWLKAEYADATISGSGEVRLYAIKQLNADISGSGNVQYRGTPSTNVKISGSGKFKSIN